MLKITENANPNYLATICRIGELKPIEKADRLVKTVVNGFDIVVSKDTKVGDIVVYFPVESALSEKFLSANNLYEPSQAERNSNYQEYKEILDKIETGYNAGNDEQIIEFLKNKAKSKCGFFNKHGRVRMIKLCGEYSMGFIIPVESLVKAYPETARCQWETLVGTQFNMCCDDMICKKYIPDVLENPSVPASQKQWKRSMKKLKKFDKLVPGQFEFHYDTTMLAEHIREIKPSDVVDITVKLHGASAIISRLLCNRPLTRWEKIKKFLGLNVNSTEYDNVYSSRRVIKNRYINPNQKNSFYETDVWGEVNNVLYPYLNEGMTVYGEIIGFESTGSPVQKKYDYGCRPKQWKFMPYRITTTTEYGAKFEWNVTEVLEWTTHLILNHPDLCDRIMPITLLYHGRLDELYPEIKTDENWHANILEALKNEKKFGMEELEPLCKNKVPREGIVIRINHDMLARAWKLKTKAFGLKEAIENDNGNVNIEDIS